MGERDESTVGWLLAAAAAVAALVVTAVMSGVG